MASPRKEREEGRKGEGGTERERKRKRVVYKMYRNSAQTGTERKGKQNRQNERESERISEDEQKESKKLYIHLKRDEIRV